MTRRRCIHSRLLQSVAVVRRSERLSRVSPERKRREHDDSERQRSEHSGAVSHAQRNAVRSGNAANWPADRDRHQQWREAPAQQALAISDITRDLFTENLAGGSGQAQPVGGFGSMLGPIYVTRMDTAALPGTVNLLTNAMLMATEADLGLAKYYFANGTISNGGPPAVAPPGYTLPTLDGLPNSMRQRL